MSHLVSVHSVVSRLVRWHLQNMQRKEGGAFAVLGEQGKNPP